MSFILFMSLKLIKATQKCLIISNLLSVLINKVLIKIQNLYLIHFISLKFLKLFIFESIFEYIR